MKINFIIFQIHFSKKHSNSPHTVQIVSYYYQDEEDRKGYEIAAKYFGLPLLYDFLFLNICLIC